MTQDGPFRFGARGSPLAITQAKAMIAEMAGALGAGDKDAFASLEPIKTSGDRLVGKPLRDFGGKGLFVKELDEALLEDRIDIAVHSLKDLPAETPPGVFLGGFLPREDPRDAFISASASSFDDLPQGARLGTASLRRAAQASRLRPDLEISSLRGNVHTRLQRIREGAFDATFLAAAGLNRLGRADVIAELMPTDRMPPALCQGIVAATCREDDDRARAALAAINDAQSELCAHIERAFLRALDGSCRMPIAGLAAIEGADAEFYGEILSPDGTAHYAATRRVSTADLEAAADAGASAGAELREAAGPSFFDALSG